MPSYLPPYLTSISQSAPSGRLSSSTTYDYSGQDEILKRQDEAGQLAASRWGSLYNGDIAGSVSAGHRIRDLLSSLNSIAPARVGSTSSSLDFDGGAQAIGGHHNDDEAPSSQPINRLAPNRMNSGLRKKTMPNALAGSPRIDPGIA